MTPITDFVETYNNNLPLKIDKDSQFRACFCCLVKVKSRSSTTRLIIGTTNEIVKKSLTNITHRLYYIYKYYLISSIGAHNTKHGINDFRFFNTSCVGRAASRFRWVIRRVPII